MGKPAAINQETNFLYEINGLVSYLPKDKYEHIEVRKMEILQALDTASKMDRNPLFIREMFAYGEEQAEEFLKRFRSSPLFAEACIRALDLDGYFLKRGFHGIVF